MSTIFGARVFRGVELDLMSELDIEWQDDSFSHEFGTEVCGHAQVERVSPVELDGNDLRERIIAELLDKGKAPRRRRLIRLQRRILRDIDGLNPDEFWGDKALNDAAEGWEPPEPDYDDSRDERRAA
jgi:hypothetical protein